MRGRRIRSQSYSTNSQTSACSRTRSVAPAQKLLPPTSAHRKNSHCAYSNYPARAGFSPLRDMPPPAPGRTRYTLCALRQHQSQPLTSQWLNRCKQRARTQLLVGVVFFVNLPAAQRERCHLVANQKTRALIKAKNRVKRIIRQCI